MKEKMRITSRLTNTSLVCKTLINGEWYILTDRMEMMTASEFEVNYASKGRKILTIPFTPTSKTYELEYDTDDKPLPPKPKLSDPDYDQTIIEYEAAQDYNQMNRRKRIAVKELFGRHNQLELTGGFSHTHEPSATVIGSVEIVTRKALQFHNADQHKVKVFTMIDALSPQEFYNVVLYYAPHLATKRMSEAKHGLIGLKGIGTAEAWKGGVMWQKHNNLPLTNSEDYLANYKDNPNIAIAVYVEKAKIIGLITQVEGNLYLKGDLFIGQSTHDAVAYFSKDMQRYLDIVQPEVNKSFKLPENDMDSDIKETNPKTIHQKKEDRADATTVYTEHYKLLVKRYIAIFGNDNIPDEHRKEKALEAYLDKVEAEKQKSAPSPTSELNQKVDDLSTNDIEVLRSIATDLGMKGVHLFNNADSLKDKIRKKRAEVAEETK